MKLLKSRTLTLLVLLAFLVTFTLGMVYAFPSRSATAEETFEPEVTKTVSDDQALLDAVKAAGNTPTLIKLDDDIELQTSEVWIDRNQTICIDLNGHTLSRAGWVIVNWWGKLYLQDSSPEKTGTIAAASIASFDALVYNYGNMVSSVNYGVKNASCVAVRNQLRLGNDFEYICNPSLTITDGTLTQQAVAKNTTLIEVIDGDLTITGGTFITSSQDVSTNLIDVQTTEIEPLNPEYDEVLIDGVDYSLIEDVDYTYDSGTFEILPPGKVKVEKIIEALHLEAYEPYRHSKVTIENGDFTSFKSTCNVVKVASTVREVTWYGYKAQRTGWQFDDKGPYDANVTISGGKWGKDFSGYVPEGKWMELVTEDETGVLETPYYRVSNVVAELAGAEVEVNDRTYSFLNFLSAWEGAKTINGDKHIVKLLRDESLVDTPISLQNVSGEMVLDLNGHTLYLDAQKSTAKHFETSGSTSYLNTFVIRDSSAEAKGELVLDASTGINAGIYFSYTGNVANTRIVLESGTIRQKGLAPSAWKDYSTDNANDTTINTALTNMSLFQIKPQTQYPGDLYKTEFLNLVTIKGGNLLSELSFGTADNIEATHPGVLFAYKGNPRQGKTLYEFGVVSKSGDLVTNKEEIFVLDLVDYLKDDTKVCKFSWDLSELVTDKGLTSNESGEGYIVSKVSEGENFLVGSSSEKFSSLQKALENAKEGDTISVLQSTSVSEAIKIEKGVTLNLSPIANFELNFEAGVTLTDATIKYGVIKGDITVAGDATLQDVTVTGNVKVESGTLTIPSGEYRGSFTVADGAKLDITGGFFRGDQIETLDPYFGKFLGAYIEAGEYQSNELYEVKLAPNLKAQKWYNDNKSKEAFEITSADEWNYFALYVNCGFDSFEKKTVQLNASSLDFGGTASGASLFAARKEEINFLPAGTVTNPFKGHLDGGAGCVMSGIVAREKFVGLIGYASNGYEGKVSVSNITVKDSTFTVGNGYLDALNANVGYLAGGAIVGDSHFGTVQNNIKIENVTVDYDIEGYNIFSGAVIGHTYGVVSVENLEMTGASVSGNWKTGGVVGMNESGDLTLKNAHISDVNIGEGSFRSGVVAGHTQGPSVTLEDCQVEAPGQSLVGAASSNEQAITVTGPKTDLHVHSLGSVATNGKQTVTIELTSDEDGNSSQVQFSEKELPSNLTITQNGTEIVKDGKLTEAAGDLKVDPENGSLVFEADSKKIDLYAEGSVHVGSYETISAALEAASEGDRIYVNENINESVTIDAGKEVIINLLGNTLTGTITVEGTLTLENGTVTGSITVSGGMLTLATGEKGLVIDNTAVTTAAVSGDYTVDGDACVRKTTSSRDVVTKLELATSHGNAKYTAEGAVIILACEYCDEEFGTVTLKAPENTTFGGTIEATVVVDPEGLVDAPEITYKNATDEVVQGITNAGKYTASITLGDVMVSVSFEVKQMTVVVSDIQVENVTYGNQTVTAANFTLKSTDGTEISTDGLTVTVTLEKSNYNVGNQVALITSIALGGEAAGNYTLATVGNQAFIEVEVVAKTLYVGVDPQGNVTYDGFVNGDTEDVLSGTLTFERHGNVVTPGGLTSENYNIVFVSGIVTKEGGTDLTALWITLAALAVAGMVVGCVVVARRKKQ